MNRSLDLDFFLKHILYATKDIHLSVVRLSGTVSFYQLRYSHKTLNDAICLRYSFISRALRFGVVALCRTSFFTCEPLSFRRLMNWLPPHSKNEQTPVEQMNDNTVQQWGGLLLQTQRSSSPLTSALTLSPTGPHVFSSHQIDDR